MGEWHHMSERIPCREKIGFRRRKVENTPRKDKPMKCLVCHHDMVERHVTLDLRCGGELVVIEAVPAIVCENCGEQVFTPDVVRLKYLGDCT